MRQTQKKLTPFKLIRIMLEEKAGVSKGSELIPIEQNHIGGNEMRVGKKLTCFKLIRSMLGEQGMRIGKKLT